MKHPHPAVLLVAVASLSLSAQPRAGQPAADERTVRHVLSRITFGARPGDVARVRQQGLERFVDEQLHPDRISDPGVTRRLDGFETLRLSSRAIAERYELPALQEKRKRQTQSGDTPDAGQTPQQMARNPERQRANLPLIELSQQKIIRAVYSERQLEEVLTDF